MINNFEQKIKSYWAHTPAVVVVKEIKRRTELPKWEDCPKDHIYIGVSRRKNGDKVTVVKHKMEMILELKVTVEEFPAVDHRQLGVLPYYIKMICSRCGEFSTRMNVGCMCQDCTEEAKKQ